MVHPPYKAIYGTANPWRKKTYSKGTSFPLSIKTKQNQTHKYQLMQTNKLKRNLSTRDSWKIILITCPNFLARVRGRSFVSIVTVFFISKSLLENLVKLQISVNDLVHGVSICLYHKLIFYLNIYLVFVWELRPRVKVFGIFVYKKIARTTRDLNSCQIKYTDYRVEKWNVFHGFMVTRNSFQNHISTLLFLYWKTNFLFNVGYMELWLIYILSGFILSNRISFELFKGNSKTIWTLLFIRSGIHRS